MTMWEKVVAGLTIAGSIFAVGAGWNSLNNRIDRVDEKIGAIEKTLGSTNCNAILTRQIEAIEKGKADARAALEGLSNQYGCAPENVDLLSAENAMAASENLTVELNAIDAVLDNGN